MARQDRKPKLMLYIGSLRKGGAERVMGNLAEYFYTEGWETVLITTYHVDDEYILPHGLWDPATGEPYPGRTDGIRRIYSEPPASMTQGSRLHNFRSRVLFLRDIWKREQPDCILSFLNSCNNMALLSARGLQVPVVVSVRAVPALEYARKKDRIPMELLFPRAAAVVLQTRQAENFFPKNIRKRAVILPNPINPEFLLPRYEGEREKTVVCVGRIDENKNQAMLLRAFASVSGAHPEYTLHFYGSGESEESCQALAEKLSIGDRTYFHGSTSGIPEKIRKAGIFVLPSRTEGMPNALLEAMSLGLACISTDCPCGGPGELIRDGENGFLVPVDDDAALAQKLSLLMGDDSLVEKLGRNACRVQEDFQPGRISERWKELLLSCMNRKTDSDAV